MDDWTVDKNGVISKCDLRFRNDRGCSLKQFNDFKRISVDQVNDSFMIDKYIQQQVNQAPDKVDWMLNTPPETIIEVNSEDFDNALQKIDPFGSWKYGNVRHFCKELNKLVIILQEVCTAFGCPSMVDNSNSVYMCAGHNKPNNCAAIDYVRHTLDMDANGSYLVGCLGPMAC
ncbi:hypothetical protein ACOME3_008867 [Neoechinorhynchus agilis]